MKLHQHFEIIRQLIRIGRTQTLQMAYAGQLKVYWQVGAYVYQQLSEAEWGDKVVDKLATWLRDNEPALKGFDRRSLYRMQEFFTTWQPDRIKELENKGSLFVGTVSPQLQGATNQSVEIMSTVLPQLPEIPQILTKISWSHHLVLLSKAQTLEEKFFYLLLTVQENYSVRELSRQISSGYFERRKLGTQQLVNSEHPEKGRIPEIFKDRYIFEFLELHEPFSESELQKGLIQRLKDFILELGRDFIFIDNEFSLKVGMHDYFIDLLFFHRELKCLVAFELKIDEFKPEYLGKLNFYLEALDRDVKKAHEQPSIGVLLCKTKDQEVVEYALSRNISPALVAEYETKLPDKGLLQKMLHEWSCQMDKEIDK